MNRTQLIDAVGAHAGITRQQAEAAIDAVVYEVTAGVKSGEPVRITGFGTFKLRERRARQGRNPQTGAPVKVKASKGIGFTPGVRLKADLNARGAVAKPESPAASTARAVPAARKRAASPAKKVAAKKAVAKKTVAKKAAPARSAAKRVVAKKAAPAKSTARKVTAAKKAPVRKAVAKKAPARKVVAKKAPARKATGRGRG